MNSTVRVYQKYKILSLKKGLSPPRSAPLSSSPPPPLPTLQASGLPGMLKGRKRGRGGKALWKISPSLFFLPPSLCLLSLSLPLPHSVSLSLLMPRLNPFTITFNHYLSFYLLQLSFLNRAGVTSCVQCCSQLTPTGMSTGPSGTRRGIRCHCSFEQVPKDLDLDL